MFVEKGFTKEKLDYYLKELAKEFRKRNGKNTSAEIVLVGGAAILANYGFREMTYDIDAVITASSALKEAVNTVGDRLGLPNGWLNADFKNTSSYSPKLSQYSKYYRTYSNVLNIRTISSEYLVAMKLMSGRRYKKDLSDMRSKKSVCWMGAYFRICNTGFEGGIRFRKPKRIIYGTGT